MYQKIQLIGNIGSVQELRNVGESSVLNFSLAVNKRYKTRNGDRVEETAWFRCALWGGVAEALAPWLRTGKQVFVDGELQFDAETGSPRVYVTSNDETRSSFEVRVNTIQLLGSAKDSNESAGKDEPISDIPF